MNEVEQEPKPVSHIGNFWCHIRKDFFKWDELIAYYKLCDLIENQNNSKG